MEVYTFNGYRYLSGVVLGACVAGVAGGSGGRNTVILKFTYPRIIWIITINKYYL